MIKAKGMFKPFAGILLKVVCVACLVAGLIYGGVCTYEYVDYYVTTTTAQQFEQDFLAPAVRVFVQQGGSTGRASGVIVYSGQSELDNKHETYVLTCAHVVVDHYSVPIPSISIEAWSLEGKLVTVDATLLHWSPEPSFVKSDTFVMVQEQYDYGQDLALLKLNTDEPFRAAKLMAPENFWRLEVDSDVIVVGSALGERITHTRGQITLLHPNFMQVNASIIMGVSGGPCYLASTGEIIGIANGVFMAHNNLPISHLATARPIHKIDMWLKAIGYSFLYETGKK